MGRDRKRCLSGRGSGFCSLNLVAGFLTVLSNFRTVGNVQKHLHTPASTLLPQPNHFSWTLSTPSKSGLWNPNVSVSLQELFSRQVHCIRQGFRAAHSWIIWLEDGVLVTGWGDGAWPRQVSSGSHTSVSINDISSEPVLMPRLIDELLDLEQVTRRFLHTAVGGG